MRPSRSATAPAMRWTAGSSETSAMRASALPPRDSISATTASTSARLARPLTATAAPASARASAMARPMLRPAPVTMATRPASSLVMAQSPSQDRQIDGTVPQSARQREGCGHAVVWPAAGAGIAPELLLEIGAGQRLAGPAAEVRLAFLDQTSVGETCSQMAGVLERMTSRIFSGPPGAGKKSAHPTAE